MSVTRREFLLGAGGGAAALAAGCGLPDHRTARRHPDVIYILADDLGIGDLRCFNPSSRIPTPNLDRLASEGMRCTDTHSPSAVCTPTRYGILTGRYAWRTRLASGVTWGYSRHLLEPDRLTVADLLRRHGYTTACVGKWHLGWDWALREGVTLAPGREPRFQDLDFTRPIGHGPVTAGFDHFFGIPASLDMQPYVYVENDRVVTPPTGRTPGRKGLGFFRAGPAAPDFRHEEVLDTLADKAEGWIDGHCRTRAEDPFFLYFPLTAPHTPILPTAAVRGSSGIGDYGDFVVQCDMVVGRILDALRRHGRERDALVIFTSDNGFAPAANTRAVEATGHMPSHIYRGYKADIYEGGHRIPFLARWPGRIAPGSRCDATLCLTDLLATAADVVGADLPPTAGEDSVSFLPLLTGRATTSRREATVHHSVNGSFAVRQGRWKLELCPGSGGWSAPRPAKARKQGLPPVQLYDLHADPAERVNLQARHPEVVARLVALLQGYVDRGRSTPGPRVPNDRAIKIVRGKG